MHQYGKKNERRDDSPQSKFPQTNPIAIVRFEVEYDQASYSIHPTVIHLEKEELNETRTNGLGAKSAIEEREKNGGAKYVSPVYPLV